MSWLAGSVVTMTSRPAYPSCAAISNAAGVFSGYTDAVDSTIGASGTWRTSSTVGKPMRSTARNVVGSPTRLPWNSDRCRSRAQPDHLERASCVLTGEPRGRPGRVDRAGHARRPHLGRRDRARHRLRYRVPPAALRPYGGEGARGRTPRGPGRRGTPAGRGAAGRRGTDRRGAVAPPARCLGGRRARPLGVLLRPRLRTGPDRTRPRHATRRRGVRNRQRRDALDVRLVVPPLAAQIRSRRGREILGPAGRLPYAGRHELAVLRPGGAGGGAADRVPGRARRGVPVRGLGLCGRLRGQPVVAALLIPCSSVSVDLRAAAARVAAKVATTRPATTRMPVALGWTGAAAWVIRIGSTHRLIAHMSCPVPPR